DTAGNVHAAERKNLECEVAGFGAVDVGPEVQGFDTDRTGFVEAVLSDFRSRIGVGIGKGWMFDGRIDEFVDGAEDATGEEELKAGLRIAAAHEAKQLDLLFGMRRKVGVAAFGGNNAVT